jgi:heptosyltransferase-2
VDVENIVIVRLSSLGDVVLALPVADNLKAAYPRAKVTFLVKEAFAPAVRAGGAVDETACFEERGFWGWAAAIRRRRPALFVDLHDTPRTRLWGILSGAERVLRYDKRALARRALVWFKRSSPHLAGHVVDRYLESLAPLGISCPAREPRLKAEGSFGREWGSGPFLGVAPGARHATKRWAPDRFARAAGRLARERNMTVVLFGDIADRPVSRAVAAGLEPPFINVTGETTLAQMIAGIGRCSLFLTNDSGAMHVAAALGVPTAAVFGPTVEAFGFFPRGERAAVAEAPPLPCRPCSLHGLGRCPLGHFQCMGLVEPDHLVEAARRAEKGAA